MGTISASTGLNSGIDITGTITKLMAINSQPVTALTTTDTTLTNQETAVTQLSALLLSVQNVTQSLGQASVWGSQSATSSDSTALSATVTGTPAQGTYQYTPLQMAQSQQLLSSGVQSATQALGGGTFTFRYGNRVDQGVSLSSINGGQGFASGSIRITDRSGASAVIDLSNAQNINDVVQAINTAGTINVTASTQDGHIVLTDDTGQNVSDLKVQEVNGGTTAASLGLSGIDVAASSAAGNDILTLSSNLQLSALNDGMGIQTNLSSLGDINYTLHNGSGTIDLSQLGSSPTLGNVIQQINTQSGGNLQASISTDGKSLVVEDMTTGSGTFSISDAVGSTAASDLGLVDSTSANTVTSSQVFQGQQTVLGSIDYTLHNGAGSIDLSQLGANPTLGDVIQQINTQSGGNLQASISADGQGLVVKDMTTGSGTFSISDAAGSTAASDLGLVDSTSANTVTGSQILGGLNTVLLSDLNGGQGLGTLGYMKLTDENGHSVNVNLAGSVTLQDVIGKINSQSSAANVGIMAAVNAAGNGIQLVDTTGAVSGTLTAANSDAANDGGSDGLNTAVKLGFATQSAPGTSSTGLLNSGDLHLRSVSRNTLLSSYNGGAGVAQGSIQINETNGSIALIDVTSSMQTIGDVIDAINRNTSGVHASINATGDGIVLQDTAHGKGTLSVTEGNSTTAHDLDLLGTESVVGGVQTIDGSTTRTITLQSGDTLTTLQNDINNLGGGLAAGIVTDSSSNPYRLSLSATQSGQAGNMIVDTSQLGSMSLQELTHGQNALLALGNAGVSNAAVVVSSSTNTFSSVLPGVALQINNATGQPVSIAVGNDGTNIATTLQTLVTDYNSFRTQLTSDTAYNTATETGSVLSDDPAALQLDSQLSQLLSSSFASSGPVQSLADVGISVQSDGSLSFNQTQFDSAWSANPNAVQQLFTTKTTGVSDRFNTLIRQLAGTTNSVLSARISALQQQITDNQSSITKMNQRLNDEQNLLYTQFYNMDLTIGKLKNTQSLLSNITLLAPNTGVSNSSGG